MCTEYIQSILLLLCRENILPLLCREYISYWSNCTLYCLINDTSVYVYTSLPSVETISLNAFIINLIYYIWGTITKWFVSYVNAMLIKWQIFNSRVMNHSVLLHIRSLPITKLSQHTAMRRLRYVFLLTTCQTVVLRMAGLNYLISKENIGCWLPLIFLIFFLLKVGLWHCSCFTKTPQPFFNLVYHDKTPSIF